MASVKDFRKQVEDRIRQHEAQQQAQLRRQEQGAQFQSLGSRTPSVREISPEEALDLGQVAGDRIFELQRRRLASQGQAGRRDLARLFAGRGGGSSEAFATRRLLESERSALADASLQAQLAGQQFGVSEAERLTRARQFNAQLQQNRDLANFQGQNQFGLANLQNIFDTRAQREARAFAAFEARRAKRGGFLGKIGSALGRGAVGFLTGGPAGAALGAGSGLAGEGGGGGTSVGGGTTVF